MSEDLPPVLRSLLAAVDAAPRDVPLRLHVARTLLEEGYPSAAAEQCLIVLRTQPDNDQASALLGLASASLPEPIEPGPEPGPEPEGHLDPMDAIDPLDPPPAASTPRPGERSGYDWSEGEREVSGIVEQVMSAEPAGPAAVLGPEIFLEDVVGLEEVKQRLDHALFNRLRNPELHAAFGRSLHGGLLLYGPPGCGKTFVAQSVSGELGALFHAVDLRGALDTWAGGDHVFQEVFAAARDEAPCVLYLDGIESVRRRSASSSPASTGPDLVQQLLTEMEAISDVEVYLIAATDRPWDVDAALLRHGRLDRTLLVPPPDRRAREALLAHHLEHRSIAAALDLGRLARSTERFSRADLAQLCECAAELAGEDDDREAIAQEHFDAALEKIQASTPSWFADARAAGSGKGDPYDELVDYLRRHPA